MRLDDSQRTIDPRLPPLQTIIRRLFIVYMGVCPCTRDAKPAPQDTEEPVVLVEEPVVKEPKVEEVQLNVHLKADETVVRLAGPFSTYYRLIEEVEAVGAVKTHVAEYLATKQRCRVKAVPKSVSVSKGNLERMASLDHPHLLRTYEVCQDQDFKYLVTECCAMSLHSHVTKAGMLSESATASVLQQVLYALSYCHAQGLLHCALSPYNIQLKQAPQGELYVIRVGGLEESQLVGRGVGMAYVPAPELLEGSSTDKSDVWSCGVLLYYLLSGSSPYNPGSLVRKYPGFSFPPETWHRVHPEAITLITSMLNKRPASRPSAVQCLANSWLRSKAQSLPLSSRPVTSTLALLQTKASHSPMRDAVLQFMLNRVLSDLEITRLAQVFSAIDANCGGIISRDELILAFQATLSLAEAEREADKVLKRLDKNQNGELDYSEFLLSALPCEQLLTKANLRLTFRALDRDGSGQLSLGELKAFFRINSKPGSMEQWKQVMAGVDSSGDGEISFEEFEALMRG